MTKNLLHRWLLWEVDRVHFVLVLHWKWRTEYVGTSCPGPAEGEPDSEWLESETLGTLTSDRTPSPP